MLRPADVGLPDTARRRVPGLRRSEVAELASVSSDWYRSFECGRPVLISPPLVARLAEILRLTPAEEMDLHILARPELYKASKACATRPATDASAIDLSRFRRFVTSMGAASDIFQCAQIAADAAQDIINPKLTVVALFDAPPSCDRYAVGPRGHYWTSLHHEVASRLHLALKAGGIGCCEHLLSTDELRTARLSVNTFRRLNYEPTTYEHFCELDTWSQFNARVDARSALIVPLFDSFRFRGVIALGWNEPRQMQPPEIEALATIGGVVALSTR